MEPAPSSSTGARVFALGELRIFDAAGQPVPSLEAQPKRAALLIYLASLPPGQACPRDHLLAMFWPDFDDERARNSLRTSLYYVRRAIGPEIVQSRPDGALAVDPQLLWCDVRAFEAAVTAGRWSEAAGMYGGDFFAGGAQSASVEFDQWVEATRRRLRRQCADALFRVAEGLEMEDEMDGALEALARARALLPADEAILRKTLVLWSRRGNRVRAVQEYEIFASTLRELYELEPSPETQEIMRRVTAGAPPHSEAHPPLAQAVLPPRPSPGPEVPAETAAAAPADTPVETPAPPASRPVGWRRAIARWAAVGALVVVSFLGGRIVGADGPEPAGDVVAMLPFRSLGGEASLPVAAALPALLADELRRSGSTVLEVRSVDGLGERWDDQVSGAGALGAGVVVTGEVVVSGDSVVVLVATVPASGSPVPTAWARATAGAGDPSALAAALARQLRAERR